MNDWWACLLLSYGNLPTSFCSFFIIDFTFLDSIQLFIQQFVSSRDELVACRDELFTSEERAQSNSCRLWFSITVLNLFHSNSTQVNIEKSVKMNFTRERVRLRFMKTRTFCCFKFSGPNMHKYLMISLPRKRVRLANSKSSMKLTNNTREVSVGKRRKTFALMNELEWIVTRERDLRQRKPSSNDSNTRIQKCESINKTRSLQMTWTWFWRWVWNIYFLPLMIFHLLFTYLNKQIAHFKAGFRSISENVC